MFFDSGPNLGQVAATPVLARVSVFNLHRPTYQDDVYKAEGGFSDVYQGEWCVKRVAIKNLQGEHRRTIREDTGATQEGVGGMENPFSL